jgi:cell division protein FtsA
MKNTINPGKSDVVTGLDMGSGRITCIIAEHNEASNKIRILSGASLPCNGLKGGMVVNIEETARAVEKVIDLAERKAKVVVTEVYLGVRGAHIQTFDGGGKYHISRSDQEITSEDIYSVIENAKAFQMSPGLEILHVIAQKFTLDQLPGISNPIGMDGTLLEAGVHIVMASSSAITNLLKSVSEAGFRVIDNPIYTAVAVGELVVTQREKDIGCLLIDAGGQTTSIAAYTGGCMRFSKELPIGGDHITGDLAIGLKTSMPAAQEIKEKYGATLTDLIQADSVIRITGLDARIKKDIKQRELLNYIQPRIEELFEMISAAVPMPVLSNLPGGAILTGGASQLIGMREATGHLLELEQVRKGFSVPEILECPEAYAGQTYLGAAALVCYPFLKPWHMDLCGNRGRSSNANKIWRWFSDLF